MLADHAGAPGSMQRAAPPSYGVLGVNVADLTIAAALALIEELAQDRERAGHNVFFVNAHSLNIAFADPEYRKVLNSADCVFGDGTGVRWATRLIHRHDLLDNVNGTDLFPLLCERIAGNGRSLFLLGARPGIAAATAAAMQARFPGLRVAGVQHGYYAADEEQSVIEAINASGADILLVAFGVPRQELWLSARRGQLRPAVRMGVGGLFDFYSGRIPRAPMWMRDIGLEWVWRFLQEPGRMWNRYLIGNPLFLYRAWQQARHLKRSAG